MASLNYRSRKTVRVMLAVFAARSRSARAQVADENAMLVKPRAAAPAARPAAAGVAAKPGSRSGRPALGDATNRAAGYALRVIRKPAEHKEEPVAVTATAAPVYVREDAAAESGSTMDLVHEPRHHYHTRAEDAAAAAAAAASEAAASSAAAPAPMTARSSGRAASAAVANVHVPVEHDIDSADLDDPQKVATFAYDIFQHYMRAQGETMASPEYMSLQPDVNEKMRAILVDWLVEVHQKFKLVPEVLPLTVNIIDRFLARRTIVRTKLQLVGVTAMLIASKYEEIYAPEVRDFVYITDKAYTREQILEMESEILNTLKFSITAPSALTFLHRFVKAARLDARGTTSLLARYLVERTLQEYAMLKFTPSVVAASAVHLALRKTGKPAWSATLHFHTGLAELDLRACVEDMAQMAANAESTSLKAVRTKYSSSRYGSVGTISWARAAAAAGDTA